MAAAETVALIQRYYAAFNAADSEAMLACLGEDVAHDVNQGGRRTGKAAFRDFSRAHGPLLRRAAGEHRGDGDAGRRQGRRRVRRARHATSRPTRACPRPAGQTYRLPAGAFFEVRDGLIIRVTTYYNLAAWLRQIAPQEAEPEA